MIHSSKIEFSSLPKGWKVRRLKDVVSLSAEKTDEHTLPYIGLENISSWDAKYISTESESDGTNNVFHAGDILYSKLRPYLAKGYLAKTQGICSTEFFVLTPGKDIDSQYLLQYLLSYRIIDFISSQVAGVKMPRTNWDEVGVLSVPLPGLDEQRKIANYLDSKSEEINAAIEARSRELELLKTFKQSKIAETVKLGLKAGVPTKSSPIGEIPAHWEVARIKRVAQELETGKREDDGKEEVLSIGGEHIQDGKFFLEHAMYVSEDTYENTRGKIQPSDILIVKDGATIGKCMFVENMPEQKMLLNEHVYRLACNSMNSNLYFYYVIASQFSQDWFWSRNMSSAQESIVQNTLLTLPIAIPPYIEQVEIAEYLREECRKIDRKCALIEQQIWKLQLLKRALINEVFTGKRQLA